MLLPSTIAISCLASGMLRQDQVSHRIMRSSTHNSSPIHHPSQIIAMTVHQATLEFAALAVFAAAKKVLGDEAIPSKAVIVGGAALWRLTQHRPTAVSLTFTELSNHIADHGSSTT